MRALAIAGGVVVLILAYYVAISDFAGQFGIWGFALAAVCQVVSSVEPHTLGCTS